MQAYFFDSSALVKRFVGETGTAWTISLFRSKPFNQIFVAEITLAEVTAALARRHRNGSLTTPSYKRASSRFRRIFDDKLFPVEVNLPLLENDSFLAEKHVLRGYDAVQLAAALEVEAERKSIGATSLTLISADNELLTAAQNEGLLTDNPNLHP